MCLTRPRRFVTFYISALEILLLTYLLMCWCAVEDGVEFSQGIFKPMLAVGLVRNRFDTAELGSVKIFAIFLMTCHMT